MSVRLNKKKQKAILKQLDQIILAHRLKIYLQLTPKIDQRNADIIQCYIGNMNDQLIREVMPMLEELLLNEPPVLPFKKCSLK